MNDFIVIGSTKDVIELTDANFQKKVLDSDEPWLVEFYAPWCGHCQRLAPEWAKAATELKGKVKLGAVDATVHTSLGSQYDIKGYPTIKFFPGGRKSRSDAENYEGGRTASEIVAWGNEKAAESAPPPELVQILGETQLSKGCNDHSLCVLSVLPHILDCDAKCRNAYLVCQTQI
jgi:protein disulfide-isomerase A6